MSLLSTPQPQTACSIRLTHRRSGTTLTVIGVYLPCQDLGMDFYCTGLTELEELVIESIELGPTMVAGDYNAHLGSLVDPLGRENTNAQDYHLHQHIKYDIVVASLLESAYSPPYTSKGETLRSPLITS